MGAPLLYLLDRPVALMVRFSIGFRWRVCTHPPIPPHRSRWMVTWWPQGTKQEGDEIRTNFLRTAVWKQRNDRPTAVDVYVQCRDVAPSPK